MSNKAVRCWGVVPAAGIGSRMASDTPKQYLEIAGATLLEHSIAVLLNSPDISGVVVALHAQDERADTLPVLGDARVQRVTGAAQRSGSVLAALDALVETASARDWVLVHDAARPCLQAEDLQRLIAAVHSADCGGLLAEPVVDTVKRANSEGRVEATVDRSALWRAQTPQMFRLGELRDALRSALAAGSEVTDEASAMEIAALPVQLVRGSASNLKVTMPADLPLAAWYLAQRGE